MEGFVSKTTNSGPTKSHDELKDINSIIYILLSLSEHVWCLQDYPTELLNYLQVLWSRAQTQTPTANVC